MRATVAVTAVLCASSLCSCRAPLGVTSTASPDRVAVSRPGLHAPNLATAEPIETRAAASPAGVTRIARAPEQSSGMALEHRPSSTEPRESVLTGAAIEGPAAAGATHAIFTPAERRVPLEPAAHTKQADGPAIAARGGAMYPEYPDEYLYDGGDRGYPYHYEGRLRAGLDTEDALVEYRDELGRPHVKPTNRVAVYAPKFGAVRTVTGSETDLNIGKAAGAQSLTPGVGLENRVASIDHTQRDMLGGIRVRERASGLDSDDIPNITAQQSLPALHTKIVNTHQDLAFVKTGRFLQTEQARIADGIQAANEGPRNEYPAIVAEGESAEAEKRWAKAGWVFGVEDMSRPGELRIVKLADKEVAEPGDEITFTIRYDNLGDRELHDIRIIDNLTPRLEYVMESAQSDRHGKLTVTDNEEGSLILTFEVAEPLGGGEGGSISFRARVK